MGASLTWMVCDAAHEKRVAKFLSVKKVADKELADYVALVHDNKLFVWEWGNNIQPHLNEPSLRNRLSAKTGIHFGELIDIVNYAEASYWEGGREVWSVIHEGEEGTEHLEERGELPECYSAMRQRRMEMQAEENTQENEEDVADCIMTLPAELSGRFTGYDPDISDLAAEEGWFFWKVIDEPSSAASFGRTTQSELEGKKSKINSKHFTFSNLGWGRKLYLFVNLLFTLSISWVGFADFIEGSGDTPLGVNILVLHVFWGGFAWLCFAVIKRKVAQLICIGVIQILFFNFLGAIVTFIISYWSDKEIKAYRQELSGSVVE